MQVALRMMNRHGLIAGATGTGKTKTLQLIAEQLSAAGRARLRRRRQGRRVRPRRAGRRGRPARKRDAELGLAVRADRLPGRVPLARRHRPGRAGARHGLRLRPAAAGEGARLNETQESSLGLVFHYADYKALPLLDLADLRALLTFLTPARARPSSRASAGCRRPTVGVLLRALVGLETGGGTEFFGEPQFDIADLMRTAPDGRGVISCLELPAVQDKPALFSTVLMWLVAELFETLPEVGDVDKPKLVFFFDEAHLLFTDATEGVPRVRRRRPCG